MIQGSSGKGGMRVDRYSYAITMKTPLGERKGQLSLDCGNGWCQGMLTLLGAQTFVQGTLDENWRCELKGELRTLLRSLPFAASGTLRPDRLSLMLLAGGRSYPIDGQRKETV